VSTLADARAKEVRSAITSSATTDESVRLVSAIFRDFIRELRAQISGRMDFLVSGDEDAAGADFACCLEVPRAEYERAVKITSDLEARYYREFGVNFVVIPEVM
jgi:hypothetical protein